MKTYSRGRVCGVTDCETVLSTYNPSLFCALHECAVHPARRARHPIAERICVHCAGAFPTANLYRRYCSDRCRMAAFARRKRAAASQSDVG